MGKGVFMFLPSSFHTNFCSFPNPLASFSAQKSRFPPPASQDNRHSN
jgi:hypothetical protein